ncbi:MAG: cyclic nucleotide-binding domain-containing protein [Methylotenera sp.]|nr:cyclic nucleotide-binding domain-containing protein [Oligoflexia bacterium]
MPSSPRTEPPPSGAQPKSFKRGDVIYSQGAPATNLYLLQSGIVSLSMARSGENLELMQVAASQVFGNEGLQGKFVRIASAVANNDVTLIEIELAMAKSWLESTPLIKTISRSLIEKQRGLAQDIFGIQMESDPTPCPPERITKLFAVLYHTASYTGTKKPAGMSVVWPSFKKYAQRTFLESPVRLEQAVLILVKLGYATLEYIPCETDPDAPDELGFVHFRDLEIIRSFFEFFREYMKSPGNFQDPSKIAPLHQSMLVEIERWNTSGKVA